MKQQLGECMPHLIKAAEAEGGKALSLFLGYTKAGKSTLVNILAGWDPDIDTSTEGLIFKGEPPALCGSMPCASATRDPNFVSFDGLTLCDLAGFGDTRPGIEHETAWSRGMREALQEAKSVRSIVLVMDYASILTSGAELIKKVMAIFLDILPPEDRLSPHQKQAISYVLTKVPDLLSKRALVKCWKELMKECKRSDNDADILFMIRKDMQVYLPENDRPVTLADFRSYFLDYTKRLPPDTFSKHCFFTQRASMETAMKCNQAWFCLQNISKLKPAEQKERLLWNGLVVLHTKIKELGQALIHYLLISKSKKAVDTAGTMLFGLLEAEPTFAMEEQAYLMKIREDLYQLHEAVTIYYEEDYFIVLNPG